ncbi:MAG: restriction endonuclease [Bacteroidia bacterium]
MPIDYLSEIINDPKVVPMIRGKAFEYSAMIYLQTFLPVEDWLVDKPILNPQFGIHDMDVRVTHIKTGKSLSVECKLAGKGRFKVLKNGGQQIDVKCMRSRTLGDKKATESALKLGLDAEILKIHNDQYLPTDFDVVLTSIANTFYTTEEESNSFEWNPTDAAIDFLHSISREKIEHTDLQYFAYHKMYLAAANDLAVKNGNTASCSRKACSNPSNCGFIPNYPSIIFEKGEKIPNQPWVEIENAEQFFKRIISLK